MISNDITLRRDQQSALGPDGLHHLTSLPGDKRHWEADSKVVEFQKQVFNLQTHAYYLEKQLERLITMNPEMQSLLDQKAAENAQKLTEEQLSDQSQLASLIANSQIMRSYEAIMQQYEVELESKTKQISQMQTESAQLTQENSELSQQLYVLKTKVTGKEGAITSDEDRIEKIQKDQMVQLLKRNHDTLMQKYELFRQRNEALEKMAVEKEALYNEMKLDADKTGQELFRVQKSFEETRNQKEIFESKVKRLEEAVKSKDEQIKALKVQKEKYEGQSKVLNEQLELIQNSHDQLSAKKGQEVEMLTKEISQLSLKEKDTKQKLHWVENELSEVKDQLRSMTTELDTRTQENDHLISLLEDYEQKVATYEQREKSINALSLESKKRIEEANLERDRVHLKEAQYLRQIDRLEETLKVEAAERKERHDRLLEAIREKQKTILDSRDDEISELKIKLSEALDKYDKQKVEKDSLQTQLDKMVDQWRKFKEEANQKYEQYSR